MSKGYDDNGAWGRPMKVRFPVVAAVGCAVIVASFLAVLSIWLVQSNMGPLEAHAEPGKYIGPALGLFETGRYVEMRDGAWAVETSRLPMFPLIIALTFKAFGEANYFAVAVVQAVLFGLTAVAAGAAASALHRRWFWPVTVLVALTPGVLWSTTTIMPETTFSLLVTIGLAAALWSVRAKEYRFALLLAAGLAWGLAALTRPVMLPMPFVLVPMLALALRWDAQVDVRRAIALSLIPSAIILAFMATQFPRSDRAYGIATYTTQSGEAALYWAYPCLKQRLGCGDRDAALLEELKAELSGRLALLTEEERNNPVVWSQSASSLAAERLREIPLPSLLLSAAGSYAKLLLHTNFVDVMQRGGVEKPKILGSNSQLGIVGTLRHVMVQSASSGWTGAWLVLQVLLIAARGVQVLGVVSLIFARATRWSGLLLLIIAGALIVTSAGIGNPRLRIPIEPILVIFLLAGFETLWQRCRRWRFLNRFTSPQA